MEFTHLNPEGKARMVDVTSKDETIREARARAKVILSRTTLDLLKEGGIKKGDVLTVAQIAGIQAAKKAWELIPLCHSIPLGFVEVNFFPNEEEGSIEVESVVRTKGQTGVEMEALVSCAIAALTIYDMCKSAQRGIRISDLRVVFKTGGKSGTFKGD
ncbi:MAG: cyclic pyranopterin monophosphate synthase MoaC [Caldiserica bacterium]|jgi:cyclic pyranopterin phosphate synthase|nr:cyclic pyranopterin monophosphate synthase MoaC [Caldisericota bacterium]MDH7563108.1 cyclic pyranopterin monophosphate synthase MoaC [Caldisericota bacterium]